MGQLVEVCGKVCRDDYDLTVAPVSGKKCAVYWWRIEQLIGYDKHGEVWDYVHTLYSSRYFFLEDGSGANAAIDLKHANIHGDQPTDECTHTVKSAPDRIMKILKDNNLDKFKMDKFMIVESCILTNTEVYALGSTYPTSKLKKGLTKGDDITYQVRKKTLVQKIVKRMNFLNNFKASKQKYDLNGDGRLDRSEVKKMYRDVGRQVYKESKKTIKSFYDNNAIVLSKTRNRTSIADLPKVHVAFTDEATFTVSLFESSINVLIIGIVLSTGGLAWLLPYLFP